MNARRSTTSSVIFEHLTTAVILLDSAWTVRCLNPAAESLLHLSERQAVAQKLTRLLPDFASLFGAVQQARERGASFTEREHRVALSGDNTITLDCTITPLPDDGILLELDQLDRHLRISRENQLIAQNRAIRELIRGLAHEIKNPLGGLRGAAQLLQRELADPEQREYTQIIISEADRLRGLVNGLLGPDAQPQMHSTNIHEVMERVRHLAEAEAPPGVEIVRYYDPSIPPIAAAPDQLIQALLNLVRNALQAVGKSGSVTLRTRTQRRFTLGDVQHKLVACISIIDDGPGIPPDLIDRIFYPMVTTRPEGSGIGLPIAQTLVNQHGGLIECTSEPGHTVFAVWLPLENPDG
ncbi:MAG TPA: nitrogen regulation protein NR(II) [Gammaproteobacteria bacterium]|nr:nitrogen regulation protein NR(II) [Gammaproteobacteria bacterium]